LDKHLHIISLDVPYPANYGGVYDLFYKLPALQKQGVKIHLHCFNNGRSEQPELHKYCEEVNYYERNSGHKSISLKLPYIVCSRKSEALENNLLKDEFPVLMEGVHCTAIAFDKRFENRKKFVRLHNVEHQYYMYLYHYSRSLFKKMYYRLESHLLKQYEAQLVNKATSFWSVTEKDAKIYRQKFHCTNIQYLPLFLPRWRIECKPGMGSFCLYHGKLSVDENEYAAIWLIGKIFKNLEIPLVIAGMNPSSALQKLAKQNQHTCIVANPSEREMHDLIEKAQVHVLPSFNNTGIKIKLLNALHNGRHCLVNEPAIEGTGLEELCHVVNTENAFKERVVQLYHQPFLDAEVGARKKVLDKLYNNEKNAKQIVDWIWGSKI
jgi:glycosyltransferase involved in cell wall biosynthesis